jgi:hypothetical protein
VKRQTTQTSKSSVKSGNDSSKSKISLFFGELKKNKNQTFAIKHSSFDFDFFGCFHWEKIRHKKSIKW